MPYLGHRNLGARNDFLSEGWLTVHRWESAVIPTEIIHQRRVRMLALSKASAMPLKRAG
jgi:hypothetical protein